MTTIKTSVTVTNNNIEVTEYKSLKDMAKIVLKLQEEIENLKKEIENLKNGTSI